MIPETAIQAAANAFSLEVQKFPLEQCDPYMREEYTEIATATLTAALPHIEAALRTQIAADIRAAADAADVDFIRVGNAHVRRNPYASQHYREAAQVAEKGNQK